MYDLEIFRQGSKEVPGSVFVLGGNAQRLLLALSWQALRTVLDVVSNSKRTLTQLYSLLAVAALNGGNKGYLEIQSSVLSAQG